jgi:hypothetical protein
MQSTIEQAREHALAALKHVDPTCPGGSNFHGKAGEAMIFTCATCHREVRVSNLTADGASADVEVPSLKRRDPDQVDITLRVPREAIDQARRRAEHQALDKLGRERLHAAGCPHQALGTEGESFHPALVEGAYTLRCALPSCDVEAKVTIDEALAVAPLSMDHHRADRLADAARAAADESLLDVVPPSAT